MSTSVLDEERITTPPATAKPYLLGGLAALSVGAAAIHFAVTFAHFSEYVLYGVFFLIISWAQLIWAPVLLWRPSKLWLWLGILGNAIIVAIYFASRTNGLPFGPDKGNPESYGGIDLVSIGLEGLLIVGCLALLLRPSLADRPVRRRTGFAAFASLLAFPAAVVAVSTAVMTPGWAGPEGPAGMASMSGSAAPAAAPGASAGMGDMGTTDGLPDMKMYGSTAPATAAQVIAAANLIKATDKTLIQYQNINAAFKAGYTEVLKTDKGEEHLLYNGPNPAFAGLNPQHPSSLVYATDVPHHTPILLGAMYIMPGRANGPQIGGGLTRWHSHLVTCVNNQQRIVAFDVTLPGGCNPATWHNRYTAQMMHVWVVPYTGGPFSDDLSRAANDAAVRAVLHG